MISSHVAVKIKPEEQI